MALRDLVLQQIWEENKKFLLIAGSGLVIFLFLNHFLVARYRDQTEQTVRDNHTLETNVLARSRPVRGRYLAEQDLQSGYNEIEKDLVQRFSMPPPKLPDFTRGVSPQIFFNESIDSIWGEVNEKAERINCDIPVKISTQDLGILADDTPVDNERHARYLEVLRRVLNALVDAGMQRIDKPSLHPEEVLSIKGNSAYQMVFQRISISVHGSYDAFVKTFGECQKPGRFLQALLLDLRPSGSGEAVVLRGDLEFAAFYFELTGEEETGTSVEKRAKLRKRKM